ncbi:DUF4303 domain-containing protein [Stieleria maiorica]|uniref:DUF4303 domain-containing protein n=1 Tax=Stieleria maiorica TaxID=2795974 RepID=UPI00142F2DBE|nr:DUF4303 domain-containing protein [Stieleria maiorica]
MTRLLATLAKDKDNYGFALAVPNDYGSAFFVYAVGKESTLANDSLDCRYSPVEWTPSWMPLADANDALQGAVERFSAEYEGVADAAEQEQMHDQFVTDCATACLEVLQECGDEGLFGCIWYKVLDMSDDEHPVVAEAFRRLNSGRARSEAAPLFDY